MVDVEVGLVGEQHDLAHGRRDVAAVVSGSDPLAGGRELVLQRLIRKTARQAVVRHPRQQPCATARDVDQLADDIRVDLRGELVEVQVEVVDPRPEPRGEVVAQVLGGQVIEPGARGDERAARLGHLLAVHGQEAVRVHRGRRAVAGTVQHRRPEQRVEIDDVLADEVVDLRVAFGLPVAFEIEVTAPPAEVEKAREIADRRVEPDVEVLAGFAGNLEAEIRRVAGDVPVLEARCEPLGELGRYRGLQIVRTRSSRAASARTRSSRKNRCSDSRCTGFVPVTTDTGSIRSAGV